MKEFNLWLHNGKEIVVKGRTYDELLCNIDSLFDIIKESTDYYCGYDDDSIVEQAQEQEIWVEEN